MPLYCKQCSSSVMLLDAVPYCKPCASKLVVENVNSVQQLKAEILPLIKDALDEFSDRKFDHGAHFLHQVIAKLSAV